MEIKISPSALAADFSRLGDEVRDVKLAGADYIHLDVMDGLFVPNISFGIPVIESLRKTTDIIFDTHLMIDRPERYVERFAEVGADIIVFHIEATKNISETLDLIHFCGKRAGLTIKPATPAETLFPYLEKCDMVLVMSVEPGFGGQKFMPASLDKVAVLRREIDARGLSVDIEIDGGISPANSTSVIAAGANVLVAGSSVFGAVDRRAAIEALRK